MRPPRSALSVHWDLDPDVTFLNHGSFGATPRDVLESQSRWRARLEREPVRFMVRELEALLDDARSAIAPRIGARVDEIAFVPNATTGVNAVVHSLKFAPGDELLSTDQAYNACNNALRFVAERDGARVRFARIPFPLERDAQITEAILAAVTPATRLVLLDHVTSPTGLVFPVAEISRELHARGVDVLIDGAHAPGMVPVDVQALGVAYYTANCHKWWCAPKGAAFLYVRPDKRDTIRPTTISHGANSPRTDRHRWLLEFDWTGTIDPTSFLCIPESIAFLASLDPLGMDGVMARNRTLALAARDVLCRAFDVAIPAPDTMIGSLAAVPLPPGTGPGTPFAMEPLQDALWEKYGIEVPIIPWPRAPERLVRISAQLYNSIAEYEYLAECIRREIS